MRQLQEFTTQLIGQLADKDSEVDHHRREKDMAVVKLAELQRELDSVSQVWIRGSHGMHRVAPELCWCHRSATH